MRHLWTDWVADNPFLWRDMRRWARRGFGWKISLGSILALSLPILGFHALDAFGLVEPRSLPAPAGIVLFSILSLLHLVVAAVCWSATYSLQQEATADRLDFIRILPQAPRELLGKIGVARAFLRTVAILVPLPLYALLIAYGSVNPGDVVALYILYGALLFAPPGPMEVSMGLVARHSPDAVTAKGKNVSQAQASQSLVWILSFQFGFQFLMRPVILPLITAIFRQVARAVGSQYGAILPLSVIAALARLIWQPQGFFDWVLTPAWPLFFVWAVSRAHALTGGAEMWTREPFVQSLPGGRTQVLLPEETARKEEWLLKQRLGRIGSALLFVTVAGFSWGMVESGTLGRLVGSATPAAGLAGLLVLYGGMGLIATLERQRFGWYGSTSPGTVLRGGTSDALLWLGQAALLVLLCGALGGVSPWPDTVHALGDLLVLAAVVVLFGAGWRSFLGAPDPKSGQVQTPGWAVAASFLAVVGYIAPLGVATRPGLPEWAHWAAAWSPLYTFMQLLPGLARGGSPLPAAATLALPAAAGLLLLALGLKLRPRSREQKARAERLNRDWAERWLLRLAERWDNAQFTLAAHRMLRRPVQLGIQLGISASLGVMLLLMVGLLFTMAQLGYPSLVLAFLLQPAFWEVQVGGAIALGISLLILWTLMQGGVLGLMSHVMMESSTGRQQKRFHYLLITCADDRDLVAGTVAAAVATNLPFFASCLSLAAAALVTALVFHAPWWTAAVWLWSFALIVLLSLHGAYSAFDDWRPPSLLRNLIKTARLIVPIGMPMALLFGSLFMVRRLLSQQAVSELLPALLLVFGALLSILLVATLPMAGRRAVRSVRLCREENDLERER
ncbi:MAG: hypothetical protein ACK47B_11955 [Armatimonadota bacterium]